MSSPESKLPSTDVVTDAKIRYEFPKSSIAVIGAAKRLPGANNLEELWDLISADESRAKEVSLRRIDISASLRSKLA